MIVSHSHRFVFIKTQKTAGTSIEIFLSQLCGEGDVVTPFGRPEPGHRPRNFWGFYSHMPASEAIVALGREVWRDYFTFCFERNPWDKVLSHYRFLKGRELIPADWDFDDYLIGGEMPRDIRLYASNGVPQVDFIGRYETLERDLAHALRMAGVTAEIALPRAKAGFRPEGAHYSAYYNEAQRDVVASHFAEEIALHGYRFETAPGAALARSG